MKRKITLLMLIVFTISSHGQNKLLSSITQNYNGVSWENSWGYNYEYDANNNLISETYVIWDSDVWKARDKVIYSYNASNKVILEVGQEWNSVTGLMQNSYRDTFTYTSGRYTGQVVEIWENSIWVNEWKNFLTYNGNNLPDVATSYNWEGGEWVVESHESVTYNGNNKIDTDVIQNWVSSQWKNYGKSLYTYDANNKISNIRYAEWDDFNNLWTETERTDYVLDGNGNRISETYTSATNSSYNSRRGYTYDTTKLMSSYVNPFADKSGMDYFLEDFPQVNKILTSSYYYFDAATSTYEETSRTTYNYNGNLPLSVEQPGIASVGITVFPNPTASVLNLKISNNVAIDKVVIIDMTGKTVKEQTENTEQINVQRLVKGLYVVQIFSGKEKFSSKFIKE